MSPSERRKHLYLSNLLARLKNENLSLLILSGSMVLYCSKAEGIAPLIEAIDEVGIDTLRGSIVADRVIGKASALLICYFKAKKASAKIMSAWGADVLRANGVDYFAEKLVSEIRNKTNTDMCPFEKMIMEVNKPSKAYELIRSNLSRNTCLPEP
jgi:hypothetical protein